MFIRKSNNKGEKEEGKKKNKKKVKEKLRRAERSLMIKEAELINALKTHIHLLND